MLAKLRIKTLYFLTNPLFLAIPLSLLILVLLPPLFMVSMAKANDNYKVSGVLYNYEAVSKVYPQD